MVRPVFRNPNAAVNFLACFRRSSLRTRLSVSPFNSIHVEILYVQITRPRFLTVPKFDTFIYRRVEKTVRSSYLLGVGIAPDALQTYCVERLTHSLVFSAEELRAHHRSVVGIQRKFATEVEAGILTEPYSSLETCLASSVCLNFFARIPLTLNKIS